MISSLSLVALLVLVVAGWRRRLPLPMLVYSAVVIGLMIMPSTVTARPRFVYTAFPLLIALAACFEPRPDGTPSRWDAWRQDLWSLTVAICAAGLVAVTTLYGAFAAIP
jgi:hypothetical protein